MKRTSEHVARERGLLVTGNTLERYIKLRRGSAACPKRNSLAAERIHCRSEALKAEKADDALPTRGECGVRCQGLPMLLAACGVLHCGGHGGNVKRVFRGDEPGNLTVRENPWRAITPWALPARNKAGRPSEEQAVERVRNPEDGTYPVWQAGVRWTRSGSCVEGAKNSMRVAGSST
jgi:hypothetical protein